MLNFGNKEFRNLQEQVLKNMEDIKDLKFGLNIKGNVPNVPDLPELGEVGDTYLVGPEEPYYFYVRVSKEPKDYRNIGTLQSEVAGIQGPTGEQGIQGERGSEITTGYDEPTLIAKEKDMYVRYNGELYTNINGKWELFTNLKGPRGNEGPKGKIGAQGPVGPQGPKGEKGDPTAAIRILGKVAHISDLPSPSAVSRDAGYIVTGEGNTLFALVGDVNLTWVSLGTFVYPDFGEVAGTAFEGNKGKALEDKVESLEIQVPRKLDSAVIGIKPIDGANFIIGSKLRDGGVDTNEYSSHLVYSVLPGQKYIIAGTTGNVNRPLIIYEDIEGHVIQYLGTNEFFKYTKFQTTVPEGASLMNINGRSIAGIEAGTSIKPDNDGGIAPAIYTKEALINLTGEDVNNKATKIINFVKDTEHYIPKQRFYTEGNKIVYAAGDPWEMYDMPIDRTKRYKITAYNYRKGMPSICFLDVDGNPIGVIQDTDNKKYMWNQELDMSLVPPMAVRMLVAGLPENGVPVNVLVGEEQNMRSFESAKIGICLGDSITAGQGTLPSNRGTPPYTFGETSYKAYPVKLEQITGATIYNGGVGGTRYSKTEGRADAQFPDIVDAIVSGDYSKVLATLSGDYYGPDGLDVWYNKIKLLDFNKVNFMILNYGTNDLTGDIKIDNPENPKDITTVKGAMRYGIEALQTKYPNMKIYIMTPLYRHKMSGGTDSDTYVNSRGYKAADYNKAIIEVANQYRLPVKDLLNTSGINSLNAEYWLRDGTHPTDAGYEELARMAAGFINSH